jgi:copper homeostasis protein
MTEASRVQPGRAYQLEVCVETVADALAAHAGGADRLEVCSALDLGGLTPSVGLVEQIRHTVPLPLWIMIRPRCGDFVYTEHDVEVMIRDVKVFQSLQPAGFVLGVLNSDGTINEQACQTLLEVCDQKPVVFHRAFDRAPNSSTALKTLIDLGFHRILTSGGEPTALEGQKAIARLKARAANRIEILPCGRLRAEHLAEVLQTTGCDQIHGSFAVPIPPNDSLGYQGYPQRFQVSQELVAAARAELNRLSASLSCPS